MPHVRHLHLCSSFSLFSVSFSTSAWLMFERGLPVIGVSCLLPSLHRDRQISPSQPPSGTACPHLPTSLLGRTSTTSVTTNSSATNSTTVQAPTTRSASPVLSSQHSSLPAGSGSERTNMNAAPPRTELTAEHLKRLNLGTAEGVGSNSAPSGEGAASTAPSVNANGRIDHCQRVWHHKWRGGRCVSVASICSS
jgi:hypothetical protein